MTRRRATAIPSAAVRAGLVLAAALLGGCGQKGPLFLPATPAAASAPAPAPAASAAPTR